MFDFFLIYVPDYVFMMFRGAGVRMPREILTICGDTLQEAADLSTALWRARHKFSIKFSYLEEEIIIIRKSNIGFIFQLVFLPER